MNTNATYKIRPAGRHLLTIGRDLIQDNYAAVVELVKNAYDADSRNVNIEFNLCPDGSGYSIIISDDGHGMSRDDVINKWLVPSTEDKIKRHHSPSGRILQGSKGVGRYAASILGTDLLLETVTADGEKTTVYLVWRNFEDAQYLDDVEILVKTIDVSATHGTRLTMKVENELLIGWDKDQFDNLQGELKKLKSPVSDVFNNDEFHISLVITDWPRMENIREIIQPYPLLDLFDYKISGKISEDGKGVLAYSTQRARNTIEEEFPFDFGQSTDCGELDIDVRVYDREPRAIDSLIKRGLMNESGNYIKKNEARRLLNANNGIGVYRNGFRIRPLGDADFDWLKLNEQRVQNPSLRIGSNQVIGYVQIQSEDQSNLIEKSARDGLKENGAFDRLKDVTRDIIAELEIRRFQYRNKEGLSRPASKVEQDLQKLFSFHQLKRNIKTKLTNSEVDRTTTDAIIEIVNQDEIDKNAVAEEIRQAVAIYQGQATLGKIVYVILHEGRKPLNYFKNQIPNLKAWYEIYQKTASLEALTEFLPIAEGIGRNAGYFVNLFNKLDPLAAGKRGPKESLKLKEMIEHAYSVFENEMEFHKVSFEIRGPEDFKFSCWSQDIYTIFTNLFDNSLYWMTQKSVPIRKINIEIETDGGTLIHIDYCDTGPGIESELIESEVIFEPNFTTKPNGMGLGLAIAGEAADRNGLKLKVFESEEGAHFKLQPETEDEK